MKPTLRLMGLSSLFLGILLLGTATPLATQALASSPLARPACDDNSITCTEVFDSIGYQGAYTGHDEPSVLFYSNTPGSGNNQVYALTLPKDPPTLPKQDGTGGTFNFQLHPAFWFGMAMCDSQSAPNPGMPCAANTDANIFDSANPTAPDYIGKHPGTAFMEMQFYPPGWVAWPTGNSCDATKWCAALNIDSLSENMNTGQTLNATCQSQVTLEYVNFAFITRDGKAQAPANPVQATAATFTPDPSKDLFMNSGDQLIVSLHDTAHGLQIVIRDLTTEQTGSMTASAANSFGQVQFAPTGTTCNNIPYDFHPMYSTSSEHTRVPWAAHSYNIVFSDEIGHFEYCNNIPTPGGTCASSGPNDPPEGGFGDDSFCLPASFSTRIQIGGCLGTDDDFDGVPYQKTWPGSLTNPGQDRRVNPTSVLFSSPVFNKNKNYDRVAFEADLPRIENATKPPCQRHVSNPADPNPGQGCVNPPVGASFYPIFTTRNSDEAGCLWQLGGANIPGTKNTFGGTSAAEYGPLVALAYPASNGQPSVRFNDFRRVLSNNPCASHVDQ